MSQPSDSDFSQTDTMHLKLLTKPLDLFIFIRFPLDLSLSQPESVFKSEYKINLSVHYEPLNSN